LVMPVRVPTRQVDTNDELVSKKRRCPPEKLDRRS
jgi:hypothetical protein